MIIIFQRKILAAILSSLLLSFIFSIPNGFDLNGFLNLYYIDFMFVGTYGIIASIISDWISKKLFSTTNAQEIASFLLHCFFGLIFIVFSLVTAVVFFIVDRCLKRVEVKWRTVGIALSIVAIVFILNIV